MKAVLLNGEWSNPLLVSSVRHTWHCAALLTCLWAFTQAVLSGWYVLAHFCSSLSFRSQLKWRSLVQLPQTRSALPLTGGLNSILKSSLL